MELTTIHSTDNKMQKYNYYLKTPGKKTNFPTAHEKILGREIKYVR